MIVNVRGTSGSGKTYLVKKIMSLYHHKEELYEDGRKRPIGYLCSRDDGGNKLAVIGHYEVPCGGCDTINRLNDVFHLVRRSDTKGYDVLFEGLLINSDRNRTIQLHRDGRKVLIITLSTPVSDCLDSVVERRTTRADSLGVAVKELNPRNTENRYMLAKKNHDMFTKAGLNSVTYDRKMAFDMVEFILGL